MNEENNEARAKLPPAPSDEEAVLLWVTVAVLCERLRPSNVMRGIVEAWAKEAVAAAGKEAVERGGWAGVLPKYWEEVEVAVTAFQAQQELPDKLQGIDVNKRAVQKALEAGDTKRATEAKGMFLLKFANCRDLQHSTIQKMIENARAAGDVQFFIRFGRALSEKPRCDEETTPDKLTVLITGAWMPCPAFRPGLCRLTDEALAEVCNFLLGRNNVTMPMVRKIRQRWKLKKGRKPWLKKVEKTGKEIFVS